MQVNSYKLIIPYSPDSINKVIVYGRRDTDSLSLKHKWQRMAHTAIHSAIGDGALPVRFKGRIALFFKLYFSTERNRDGDNYTLMCKGIIDALVQQHLIDDDNAHLVDDDGRRLIVDPDRPRVEIYIREKIEDHQLISIKQYENPGDTDSRSEEIPAREMASGISPDLVDAESPSPGQETHNGPLQSE